MSTSEEDLTGATDEKLWQMVAYHQGNTTFGPIYQRAKALREHPAMVELLRRVRGDTRA